MSGGPLNVFFLILICAPSIFTIRCKLPEGFIEEDQALSAESEKVDKLSGRWEESEKSQLDDNIENNNENVTPFHKQKSFIRNPNYISANKRFDKLSENMYMLELPKPHPGALGGSSRGCDLVDS